MIVPFKATPIEFHQPQLFPSHIFDLLPKDHECYLYDDLFQQLDTHSIESQYSSKGQHAYHPKRIISILIYAYSRGVYSSRQIEKRCREDLSFMFIAQMNCPNFRVLSDFRKNHGQFFSGIKNSGFRGFSVRGKEKVAGESAMVCAAHNFKKIAKAILMGLIHPAFTDYATNLAR